HIIASYPASVGNYPSYFNVIALEDDTTVSWTPRVNTAAGTGVPAVNANQTGQVVLNRHDMLQVRVSNQSQDMSGTYVTGNGKNLWVVGATECVNVPANIFYCDHIEEQMIPLDYWGTKYVAAHSPDRGNEKHHWRFYAGKDDVTITTEPVQPGTPFSLLNQGDFMDLVVPNGTSFVVESGMDEPFLAVQYLESQEGGAGTGDPSMYQMVPTEQFLKRYTFVTGTNYPLHYVQITRPAGGADVVVDGQTVNGYYTVGDFDVADWPISEGSHLAASDTPFGIISVGYSAATSYAYPGGLRLEPINPQ
ncbi:MAG: IgGFc-binding protein, partial [Myxococcales bacterium]|nr:IgGFc-binding protein [Myxococcales bacterium]